MSVESDLYTLLKDDAAVAALVSNRIFPLLMPQNPAFPAITYHRVSGPRVHSHGGPSGLASPRFQVSCWAKSYAAVRDLAEKVRLALDGRMGALLQNELHTYEPDTETFHAPLDFVIWHQE